ncbi:hypothetical protein RJ641_004400 [Dillenia turbinata]|uniref:Transmembrane protein n=1 Tax=Dillenia turbinata TaxID=194707 RepID=A0AAN8VI16_9MAGN
MEILVKGVISPRETDFVIDLESGGNASDKGIKDAVPKAKQALLANLCSGVLSFDELNKSEYNTDSCPNMLELLVEDKLLIEQKGEKEQDLNVVGKKGVKQQHRKIGEKKHPKPPRPPRGPSLDTTDLKLIQEFTELAILKRARIERMKSLKMKSAKASSSNSNLFAMLFTIFFFLVLLFQGMSGNNSPLMFDGSSKSAGVTEVGLISAQSHWIPSIVGDQESAGSNNVVMPAPASEARDGDKMGRDH